MDEPACQVGKGPRRRGDGLTDLRLDLPVRFGGPLFRAARFLAQSADGLGTSCDEPTARGRHGFDPLHGDLPGHSLLSITASRSDLSDPRSEKAVKCRHFSRHGGFPVAAGVADRQVFSEVRRERAKPPCRRQQRSSSTLARLARVRHCRDGPRCRDLPAETRSVAGKLVRRGREGQERASRRRTRRSPPWGRRGGEASRQRHRGALAPRLDHPGGSPRHR